MVCQRIVFKVVPIMKGFYPVEQIKIFSCCKSALELLEMQELIEENQSLSQNALVVYNLKMKQLFHEPKKN